LTNVKTVDNLGIETSKKFAEAEQLRRETDKYIQQTKYGRIPTERESIQSTPTKSEELLGITAQGRFATFPDIPEVFTKITAFSGGRLISSIGEGNELKKKIEEAPPELKSEKENYTKISNFADEYKKRDKDCSDIAGRCKQYNKG
jgi:hypothetical protein